MMDVHKDFSHDTFEQIKITVVLDGDLAASICNAFTFVDQQDAWEEVPYCDHSIPKINALVEKLAKELNILNKKEK